MRIHLPFANRLEAGQLLAAELSRYAAGRPATVLALARGGVQVGFAVAQHLNLKLDVVVARKIGVPWEPELAMGALAGDARILDERMIEALAIPRADVMNAVARELAEMKRREELYRGGAPLDLRGQTAILIDDGLATGTTMLAAIQYASSLQPGGVIAAVPVGSLEACRLVRAEVDQLVTLAMPEPFGAVGQFYRDFHQVGDAEVQDLLAASDRYHVEA